MRKIFLIALLSMLGSCKMAGALEKINALYRRITDCSVMVLVEDPSSKDTSMGSGTVISSKNGKSKVLTAYHVIDSTFTYPNFKLYVIWKNNKFAAKLLTPKQEGKYNPRADFAYLEVDLPSRSQYMPLESHTLQLGETIYVNSSSPWMTPIILKGAVASISDDGALAIIDISGAPGYSGSAVISQEGTIYGTVIIVSIMRTSSGDAIPVAGSSMICVIVR